jgi:hypothetical protein
MLFIINVTSFSFDLFYLLFAIFGTDFHFLLGFRLSFSRKSRPWLKGLSFNTSMPATPSDLVLRSGTLGWKSPRKENRPDIISSQTGTPSSNFSSLLSLKFVSFFVTLLYFLILIFFFYYIFFYLFLLFRRLRALYLQFDVSVFCF